MTVSNVRAVRLTMMDRTLACIWAIPASHEEEIAAGVRFQSMGGAAARAERGTEMDAATAMTGTSDERKRLLLRINIAHVT